MYLFKHLHADEDCYRSLLPEHRQIELYSKKKRLAFADEPPPDPLAAVRPLLVEACQMFSLLDTFCESRDPKLEEKAGWERYLALPREKQGDKLVAEVYRILRVLRLSLVHRQGYIEIAEGLIRAGCNYKLCAQSISLSPTGIALLNAFVRYYLRSFAEPYGDAYVEAMLAQYYVDIVAEIHRFADEDRVLFQFRQTLPFNRHQRLDCDNPKISRDEGFYSFDISSMYRDSLRYPIDFFLVIDNQLHIVPAEALRDCRLPMAEMPRWLARSEDGVSLPASYRLRFGREKVVVGLPMT